MANSNSLLLTTNLIKTFQVAKVFTENTNDYSIDFDHSGTLCLTSSSNESLHLYDVKTGKLKSTSYSKKYGSSLARFTHKPTSIIYASTKGDDAIRYMSFHDNKFLRYFKGHTKQVVGLEMSPQDDTFLSASLDDSVRLWDLRSPNCCGLMRLSSNLGHKPCVAYDQDCTIFAAGIHSKLIRLYDVKAYEKGPFTSFSINDPDLQRAPEWTHIKFSNDGKYILIVTNSEILYIVDAFTGHVKHKLTGHLNQSGLDLDANFTPDGKFVYSGSQDGNIYFWDTESGKQECVLEGHADPSSAVAWNPKYLMFASADSNLAFWIPDPQAPSSA